MSNHISSQSASAREAARKGDGKFGEQAHSESTLSLAPTERQPTPAAAAIPASLLMSHEIDDQTKRDLDFQMEHADLADSHSIAHSGLGFAAALPYLHAEESEAFFERALDAKDSGEEYDHILEEAVQANHNAHPGPKLDPKYSPPGFTIEPGYGQNDAVTGSGYEAGKHLDIAEISKRTRAELKEATKAGYLPEGLKYSVRIDRYAGGCSLYVHISGVPKADRVDPTETDHYGDPAERAESRELRRRLEGIANRYNRQDVDSQVDYFNVSYYSHVQYNWMDQETAA